MSQVITMFLTIFVAELGDKTQVATVFFAAERHDQALIVFAASACALVLGAGISTAIGAFGGHWLERVPLKLVAGIAFIVIGVWSIVQHYRGA